MCETMTVWLLVEGTIMDQSQIDPFRSGCFDRQMVHSCRWIVMDPYLPSVCFYCQMVFFGRRIAGIALS